MTKRLLTALTGMIGAILLGACASPSSRSLAISSQIQSEDACAFSAEDAAWVEGAFDAWHYTLDEIVNVSSLESMNVIFFDATCQMESATFLTSKATPVWSAKLHDGAIKLPEGDDMPPVVTSFAGNDKNGNAYFVMSTPSVWRAGGVESGMGLEMLMWPVMLHEAIHSLQTATYGRRLDELMKAHNLRDDFNDDSVQKMFEDNDEYAEMVDLEEVHFLIAANAENDEDAKRYVSDALKLMDERYDTWLVGENEKYREIDRVFLTMEGSGQWAGYTWLTAREGGALPAETARDEFGMRGSWHSQRLGFAMFMALDRIADDWKPQAFGPGGATVYEMLKSGLEE